jgi:Fe2+ transport system protein FeoA
MIPLAMASVGETVRLESIRGGEHLVHRLTALGLTPGVEFSIVQDSGGPLLISVRDSRIALGRGMAHKMMVSLIDGNNNGTRDKGAF